MPHPEAPFDYRRLLACEPKRTMRFSEFVNSFVDNPDRYLQTSASIITDAIKYYGYSIVVRGGEPTLSFRIFKDIFTNGINAVYGQELCIKRIVDAIESVDKEAGPKRGIVLVGPPASGKTNIVDMISRAMEEYSKEKDVLLYSFYFRFENEQGREVEIRSPFLHHPLLLFPTILQIGDTVTRPRQELFDHINSRSTNFKRLNLPSYYLYATLDRRSLDIVETLMQNPRNAGMALADIIEKYVRVEEIEFSNARAHGIANIDDMRQLGVSATPLSLGREELAMLSEHLPGLPLYQYEGAILASNRGLLHIHDAFGIQGGNSPREDDYKPLLMLLGSGKISMQWTQASIDNTVVMTTNLEEMDMLERHLASSKLLDRIEKVPVNYLLDANSEQDILRRDMANMRDKYDVDPNLLRIAAYYSVMTRLLPPGDLNDQAAQGSQARRDFYRRVTPEQKLFIYASEAQDPVGVIKSLPHWHPFRNECLRVGINIFEPELYRDKIESHPQALSLEDTGLFTHEQLHLLDDAFMRDLRHEHYPLEGQSGMSIRQLQNIIRNTIAHSDGIKVTVGIFLAQLERILTEGPSVHHWLALSTPPDSRRPDASLPARDLGPVHLNAGEGAYGNFKSLVEVVRGLYYLIVKREITEATVDRDPLRIALDLRKYLQHALLARALENRAFAHIMAPQFIFIDPDNGQKVEHPDDNYLLSIEKVIDPRKSPVRLRNELVQKFLDLRDQGELKLEKDKHVVHSRADNLLTCFSTEYHALLSHRREMDGINPEQVRDAFFHKKNAPAKYQQLDDTTRAFADSILANMKSRFGYSFAIALDTIVFALRHHIIDFKAIIS